MFGDEVADERNFFDIAWPGFDGQVMHFCSHAIAVFSSQQDRNWHRTDDFQDTGVWPQVSSEDNAGHFVWAVGAKAGAGGKDNIFAITGSDEQDAALEIAYRILSTHCADDYVFDQAIHWARSSKHFGLQLIANAIHGWIGKNLLVREDAKEFESLATEATPGKVADVIHFGTQHLVDNDPNDFDAFFVEQSFVKGDFIDRPPDATLADNDNFCAQNFRDLGVGQVEDGTHAGMTGAFAENKILFPRDSIKGALDFLNERYVV